MSGASPNKCKNLHVEVPIKSVLTQKCCAHVVIEIIKFLAYQRYQIPYNYDHLNFVVGKKREKDKDSNATNSESIMSKKYFKTASTALDGLEAIFKNIVDEFVNQKPPQEICIVLGSNVVCAKEVYHIKIPDSLDTHYESNHHRESQQTIRKILRTIVFCDSIKNILVQSLLPTNMYVFMKRSDNSNSEASNFFLPVSSPRLPSRAQKITINLNYDLKSTNCCNNLKIFDDLSNEIQNRLTMENNSEDKSTIINNDDCINISENWYQGHITLKGFTASFVNGESLSNFWIS